MNKITSKRIKLSEILKIDPSKEFHSFFFKKSLEEYKKLYNLKDNFGSVLVLGANHRDAESTSKYPFSKIVLSGVTAPSPELKHFLDRDKRIKYKKIDMQKIPFKSCSFDLVLTKESIHHVPRPVLAFYEMLRVAKKAIIFIEPQESLMGSFFDFLNISSKYERNQGGNIRFRDNFVYRWRRKEIVKLLNSYYLESGYKVNFISCWMSSRLNKRAGVFSKFFNILGWLLSFLPNNKGNYLICTILPGKDLPEEINP